MLENNGRQPADGTLGKSQLAGDRESFAIFISSQELPN
jgi:hypothetical protein